MKIGGAGQERIKFDNNKSINNKKFTRKKNKKITTVLIFQSLGPCHMGRESVGWIIIQSHPSSLKRSGESCTPDISSIMELPYLLTHGTIFLMKASTSSRWKEHSKITNGKFGSFKLFQMDCCDGCLQFVYFIM
jgi:hypothetical protein